MLLLPRLKTIRKLRSKTQKDIANVLGITDAAYSHHENGHRKITVEMVIKLANYYGVSTDYLLGGATEND